MKKLFLFTIILSFYSAMSFASIELSPRIFGEGLYTKYDTPGYSEDFTITDFGAELQGNIWLVNTGIFDFGLFAGIDLGGGTLKIESKEKSPYYDFITGQFSNGLSITDEFSQFTLGASVAPAVQVTLGRIHSFFISPGFRIAYLRAAVSNSSTISFLIPEFSAEAGYKLWLWENLALTAGYKYELPLSIIKSNTTISFDKASAHRIFAGISWKILN